MTKILSCVSALFCSALFAGILLSTPPPAKHGGGGGLTDVKSLAFSGSQYGTAPHITTPTTALSAAAWYKGTVAGNYVFVGVVDTATGREFYLGTIASGPLLNINDTGGTSGSVCEGSSALIFDGNWHFIAATWTASTVTITLYIDGTQFVQCVGSAISPAVPSTMFSNPAAPLCLGCYTTNASPNVLMSGQLDWISVYYNYTLTAGDVTALYNSGVPPSSMTSLASYSSATAWWPIGEGSDTTSTLFDKKGSNNISLTGVSAFTADVP